MTTDQPKHLQIGLKSGQVSVPVSMIMFLRGDSNYCHISTKDQTFLWSYTLKTVFDQISENHWVRTHKGYAVNLRYARRWAGPHCLELANGELISISKRLQRVVAKAWLTLLNEREQHKFEYVERDYFQNKLRRRTQNRLL